MVLLLSLAIALTAGYSPVVAPRDATQGSALDAMLTLAEVRRGDVVLMMGAGDDAAAQRAAVRDGWRFVRVPETAWLTVDVSEATVVLLSVSSRQIDLVGGMLKRELRPGTRIVSREFPIGRWAPAATAPAPDGTPLHLWIVPRRPARKPDIFFVPTREAVADHMLRLAGITARDVVYDLGSGDGRIVNLAAQKYGARGVGIEIDPPLVERARAIAREAGVDDRVTFIEGDLFTADISRATIVTVYLSETVNRKLEPKLRQELRPGTRVVSHQFLIGDWPPDRVVPAEDGTYLYVWIVQAPE